MNAKNEKEALKKAMFQSFEKAIKENSGSVENLAKQQRIPKQEAERIFNGEINTVDQFLNAVFYTNSSLTFRDCFGSEVIFPSPKQSDCAI